MVLMNCVRAESCLRKLTQRVDVKLVEFFFAECISFHDSLLSRCLG